jgi:hypothetical protein
MPAVVDVPFSLRERYSLWISHPFFAFNMPRPSKYSLIGCSPNVLWVDKLRISSLGNFLVLDLYSSLRSECFVQCTFQEHWLAGCRYVTLRPASVQLSGRCTHWNCEICTSCTWRCVFSWDSWLRFANIRSTGWVHAGRKGLGKYLESIYVKAFLLFSLLLLCQLTNQVAQTFVCRSQCVLPSVISYFFRACFYSLVQSTECTRNYLFLHVDLCVHIPPTGISMHIGIVAELVCINCPFDTVPWQRSSSVGTSRPPCIFCSQLIKPVFTA